MKVENILENELLPRDRSTAAKIAQQIASEAAVQFRGEKAKEAATASANRMYSIMLKSIDKYFVQLSMKEVK